jgi:ribulose kinase
MAAAKGAGWFKTIPQAAAAMAGKPGKTFLPKAASHRRYRELLTIYRDLWPTLSNWNARMLEFSQRVAS